MSDAPSPLEYSQPTRAQRPGIVTAIGVLSIVVGCLSGLAGAWGALTNAMFLTMSRVTPAVLTPPAATTVPATAPTTLPAGATTTGVTMRTVSATYNTNSPLVTTTTTTPGGPPPAAVIMNPFGQVNIAAMIASLVVSVLGLALGIFLFVLGVMVLRGSRKAVTLHWWYVLAKIPLVIAASAASVWMTTSMMKGFATSTMPAGTAPPSASMMMGMMIASAAVGAFFSLAYPVGLIFALRSRTVRDYTSAVRE